MDQGCAGSAQRQARRLYLRALVLFSLRTHQATEQQQQRLVQEGQSQWAGMPLALSLHQQLKAVDACNRLVCNPTRGQQPEYQGAFAGTRRLTLAALHALQLAMEARQAQLSEYAAQQGWQLEIDGAPLGAADIQAAYWSSEQTPLDEAAVQAMRASLALDIARAKMTGTTVLLSLRRTEQCSRRLRPVMEGLHVSKSGGTSMCELARLAGRKNPGFDPAANCKVCPVGRRSPC